MIEKTPNTLKNAHFFGKILILLIMLLLIAVPLVLPASAASYPLIIMSTWDSTPTIVEGDTGTLSFTIFVEFKNERYHVEIYDSSNKLVGSASQSYTNGSSLSRTVTITVNTASLNLDVGEYKVVYWMEFYSLYQWNTAPNKYTGKFRVVENICGGNHKMTLDSVVKEPTCEKEGKGLYSCSKCDFSEYRAVPEAHNYGDWIETSAPTCTEEGVMQRSCGTCGHSETKKTSSLGHSKISHNAQAPTCTEIGWERYDTCSRCSYTTYKQLPAVGHSYKSVVTPPSCTEKGYTTHRCSRCADTYVDSYVDAYNEHAYVPVFTPPTCTERGYTTHVCSRCDDSYRDTYVESYGGHDYVAIVTSPTCTEQGYTTHDCSRCDDVYVDTYVVALGHDFGGWLETFTPTCTLKGTERRDCSRCDHFETQKTPALGHDTVHHDGQAVSCTEIGWEAYETCNRCAYTTYSEIPATGHAYAVAKVTGPTCTKDGYTVHTCSACGDSYTDTIIPAKLHSYDSEYDAYCNTCDEKRDAPTNPAVIGGIAGGSVAVVGGGVSLWWFVFRKRRLI